ncbi:MAG: hypothetical protein AVDCRST_MAG20-1043, partial [uncultured Acidimicrobiales bacterium]
ALHEPAPPVHPRHHPPARRRPRLPAVLDRPPPLPRHARPARRRERPLRRGRPVRGPGGPARVVDPLHRPGLRVHGRRAPRAHAPGCV